MVGRRERVRLICRGLPERRLANGESGREKVGKKHRTEKLPTIAF